MSRKTKQRFITDDILKNAVKDSFVKLNPSYMMKIQMFVVEIGFFVTLILTFFLGLFGDQGTNLRLYDGIVSLILLGNIIVC